MEARQVDEESMEESEDEEESMEESEDEEESVESSSDEEEFVEEEDDGTQRYDCCECGTSLECYEDSSWLEDGAFLCEVCYKHQYCFDCKSGNTVKCSVCRNRLCRNCAHEQEETGHACCVCKRITHHCRIHKPKAVVCSHCPCRKVTGVTLCSDDDVDVAACTDGEDHLVIWRNVPGTTSARVRLRLRVPPKEAR